MNRELTRRVRLGIGSYCYPFALGTVKSCLPERPMSLFDLIYKACELDVEVVQIGDNVPLHTFSDAALDELRDCADEKGIILETGMRGLRAELLGRYIEVSHRLGARLLRCVVDAADHKPDVSEIHTSITSALLKLAKYKIVLGIENHDRFSSHVLAQIVRDLGSPHVGIVLDPPNSIPQEESALGVLGALCDCTVNLHVKDYEICRRTDAMGLVVKGVPAGQGQLNIPLLLAVLRQCAAQDFSCILEFWMEPAETAELTVAKEERWVQQSVAYLKRLL